MNNKTDVTVWNATDLVSIPSSASTPDEIVKFAGHTLSKKDINSIIQGFGLASYEMVSTFVWVKAAALMKKQLSTLGMEFVGEMLSRPDLSDNSDPATSIGDHEAIALAEDLGMITPTQGLRLKHSLELVSHFAKLDQKQGEEEYMEREEALALLKTCITAILGKPRFEAAIQFADFRKSLTERSLQRNDADVETIRNSPYFFVRTTISVLLSVLKGSKGASLEHAVGNSMVLVPRLWDKLKEPERWQVGQVYAEVNANGNRIAASGLKKALVEVRGFDFVPESLRSSTFTEAASRVLNAHFAFNNFFNEQEPMMSLASLGSTIPRPAFGKCMEATLAVWLGNRWGVSWAATEPAETVLKSLRKEQWNYYVNECLPRDRTVLDKIASDNGPMERWKSVVIEYDLNKLVFRDKSMQYFILACADPNTGVVSIKKKAQDIRDNLYQ